MMAIQDPEFERGKGVVGEVGSKMLHPLIIDLFTSSQVDLKSHQSVLLTNRFAKSNKSFFSEMVIFIEGESKVVILVTEVESLMESMDCIRRGVAMHVESDSLIWAAAVMLLVRKIGMSVFGAGEKCHAHFRNILKLLMEINMMIAKHFVIFHIRPLVLMMLIFFMMLF